MAWKNLTFILIPHSRSKIKQIRVHRNIIIGTASLLIILTGIMIFYIIGFQRKSFHLSRTREINKQNEILKRISADFDSSITTLRATIDSIESVAEQIRQESGISEKDLKLEDDVNVRLSRSGFKMPLKNVITYITRLENRSRLLEHNFNSLYNACMDNVDFLRRVPSIRPAQGFITKDFQFLQPTEASNPLKKSYSGINITNDEGTSIVATADGVVRTVDFSDELGIYIEIDHLNGYRTRYTHLNQKGLEVSAGDTVSRGEPIALMGRTGISIQAIAPHIMYSVEHNGTYVDPSDYFFASDFNPQKQGETPSLQTQ